MNAYCEASFHVIWPSIETHISWFDNSNLVHSFVVYPDLWACFGHLGEQPERCFHWMVQVRWGHKSVRLSMWIEINFNIEILTRFFCPPKIQSPYVDQWVIYRSWFLDITHRWRTNKSFGIQTYEVYDTITLTKFFHDTPEQFKSILPIIVMTKMGIRKAHCWMAPSLRTMTAEMGRQIS